MNTENQAIVIGAGLSGLAVARELENRKVPVTVLEAKNRVAEPWRNRHPQLRLNIHRHFAELPGLKMTRKDGTFVSRDTVVNYLDTYAAGINASIHFSTQVISVERQGEIWVVSTNKGDYRCRHLVVATGRDAVPHIPAWPGLEEFTGKVVHSANFGDVRKYDGKSVLVVGAGNSGTDVLNHLSKSSPSKVSVAVRHGPAIMPNRILGYPIHRMARLFALFPAWILDPVFAATQRLIFGDLSRFGLRSHPDGGGTRLLRDGIAFAIDNGFVAAVRERRFTIVSGVQRFAQNRVVLADGASLSPDVVICATGYKSGLEPVFGHLNVLDKAGHPFHPIGEADPANPGLYFTGYKPVFTGYFDAAAKAAARIATSVSGVSSSRRKRKTYTTPNPLGGLVETKS